MLLSFPYPKGQFVNIEVLNTVVVGEGCLFFFSVHCWRACPTEDPLYSCFLSVVAQGVSLPMGNSTHCSHAFIQSLLGTVFLPSSEPQLLIRCIV